MVPSAECDNLTEAQQRAKEIYFELFDTYKRRVKTKHLTYEAYLFGRMSAEELSIAAKQIVDKTWMVHGYFPFQVHHPERTINAPKYIDRIVEQWFVEKYIQPAFVPILQENNMACQSGKGPLLAMDRVKAALEECYYLYGTDFWFLQYDIEKYFDNISHDKAKEMICARIDPEMFWLYEHVVDSFYDPDCYAAKEHIGMRFGMPKGNLPSQWTGIIYLDGVDRMIAEDPGCIFSMRYMDDGISFYQTKEQCIRQLHAVDAYLNDQAMCIHLHPVKTLYAPISRGFTFCGWRYSMDKDGTIHIRIRQSKKREMEQRLKTISRSVREGKMSLSRATQIRDGMIHYLSHGTESGRLIRYLCRQYPFV